MFSCNQGICEFLGKIIVAELRPGSTGLTRVENNEKLTFGAKQSVKNFTFSVKNLTILALGEGWRMDTEFWLGNDKLNILSNKDRNVQLCIDLWEDVSSQSDDSNENWLGEYTFFVHEVAQGWKIDGVTELSDFSEKKCPGAINRKVGQIQSCRYCTSPFYS